MNIEKLLEEKKPYRVKSQKEFKELINEIINYANEKRLKTTLDLNWLDVSQIDSLNFETVGRFVTQIPDKTSDFYLDISGWDFSNAKKIEALGPFINRFVRKQDHDKLIDKFKFDNLENSEDLFAWMKINKSHRIEFPKAKTLIKLFNRASIKAPVKVIAPKAINIGNALSSAYVKAPVEFEQINLIYNLSHAYATATDYPFDLFYLRKFIITPEKLSLLKDVQKQLKHINKTVDPKLKANKFVLTFQINGLNIVRNEEGVVAPIVHVDDSTSNPKELLQRVNKVYNMHLTDEDMDTMISLSRTISELGFMPPFKEISSKLNQIEHLKTFIKNKLNAKNLCPTKGITSTAAFKVYVDIGNLLHNEDFIYNQKDFKKSDKKDIKPILTKQVLTLTLAADKNPNGLVNLLKMFNCAS